MRGMDIKKCVFLTVNVFRREFFIRPAFRVLAMPLLGTWKSLHVTLNLHTQKLRQKL